MGFLYAPSQFRIPAFPNLSISGLWRGVGADNGYYAFSEPTWGYYAMTKGTFCYSLVVGGSTLSPVMSSVNGYGFWTASARGGGVYYSFDYGWVYAPGLTPGTEPCQTSEYDSEKMETTYSGDEFYKIPSLPTPGSATEMTGMGSLHGQTKEISAVWSRWTSDREFGEYEAQDGASGTRILGLPRFRGNGEYLVRSYAKTLGKYTYGAIHYANGKWLYGTEGSSAGWHEGSEPSKDGSVTFKFTKNEGSDAEGSDFAVSFVDYVKGGERHEAYLGEVATWK